MHKNRFRILSGVATALFALSWPVVFEARVRPWSVSQTYHQRSGQLGGRHDRSPGDSGRAGSEGEASSAPSPRRLREIVALEKECLDQVNLVREAHGVSPLSFDEDLLEVARAYSRRMAEEKFFAHEDPEGRTVRQRVDRAGIKWRMIGENLAYSNGYLSPVAASLRGWMESDAHRRNMLDPDFRQTAIGAWISSNGTVYFTEIFLKR
jgi:uncharacterized protein YkwD